PRRLPRAEQASHNDDAPQPDYDDTAYEPASDDDACDKQADDAAAHKHSDEDAPPAEKAPGDVPEADDLADDLDWDAHYEHACPSSSWLLCALSSAHGDPTSVFAGPPAYAAPELAPVEMSTWLQATPATDQKAGKHLFLHTLSWLFRGKSVLANDVYNPSDRPAMRNIQYFSILFPTSPECT